MRRAGSWEPGAGRWYARARISLLTSTISLLVSCTDPRSRPAPPIVDASVAPSFQLTSPGIILGSLYMFDDDGLDALELSIRVAGFSYQGDSTILLSGLSEETRPINWILPPGIIVGTQVTVIARVTDFAGFASSDSLFLIVEDSVSTTLRNRVNRLN